MRLVLALLFLLLLAAPALAQLDYKAPPSAPTAEAPKDDPAARIKRTRATEDTLRPDWYGLFVVWAKQNPGMVLNALKDPVTFDDFANFMACDWVRDFRSNDVVWPSKQVEIVQKFNERALNPQTRYRLLTYAVLDKYIPEQEQFIFRPLENAGFSIKFPDNKAFGIEDDCEKRYSPLIPWPREFIINFTNPDFITALPMKKLDAEYFIANLPKNEKGVIDRRLVVEVEFDIVDFKKYEGKDMPSELKRSPPVKTEIKARRAIVYADSNRRKELGRFGFPKQ